MKILGLDPGGTTGWALIEVENKKIAPINFGDDKDTTMSGQRENIETADLVIIENFLIDPKHAQRGAFNYSDMVAPQVIGSLKTMCSLLQRNYEMQPASIKPIGYGFLGKQYVKGKKNMHQWDALAHAVYYAVKKLGALPLKRN